MKINLPRPKFTPQDLDQLVGLLIIIVNETISFMVISSVTYKTLLSGFIGMNRDTLTAIVITSRSNLISIVSRPGYVRYTFAPPGCHSRSILLPVECTHECPIDARNTCRFGNDIVMGQWEDPTSSSNHHKSRGEARAFIIID